MRPLRAGQAGALGHSGLAVSYATPLLSERGGNHPEKLNRTTNYF